MVKRSRTRSVISLCTESSMSSRRERCRVLYPCRYAFSVRDLEYIIFFESIDYKRKQTASKSKQKQRLILIPSRDCLYTRIYKHPLDSTSIPPRMALALLTSSSSYYDTPQRSFVMTKPDSPNILDIKRLGLDEDSLEFVNPDFHYPWLAVDATSKSESESKPPSSRSRDPYVPAASTPPPLTHSAHSSASSARALSLTDASTASASSLAPTPPDNVRSSLSGSTSGSTDRPKVYGARRFQRVVSAPVSRPAEAEPDTNVRNPFIASADEQSNTQSHTATVRPMFTHTSSGSAIPHIDVRPPTHYHVTPGLTDRTLSGTLSGSTTLTTRRLGGLSRFGGPARRDVVPRTEHEIAEEPGPSGESLHP